MSVPCFSAVSRNINGIPLETHERNGQPSLKYHYVLCQLTKYIAPYDFVLIQETKLPALYKRLNSTFKHCKLYWNNFMKDSAGTLIMTS